MRKLSLLAVVLVPIGLGAPSACLAGDQGGDEGDPCSTSLGCNAGLECVAQECVPAAAEDAAGLLITMTSTDTGQTTSCTGREQIGCFLTATVGVTATFSIENTGKKTLEVDRLDEPPTSVTGEWLNTLSLEPGDSQSADLVGTEQASFELHWSTNAPGVPAELPVDYDFQ
jgi:hypothetical protein